MAFSYLMTIVIVLAVMLVAATSLFILMCCWIRKKKASCSCYTFHDVIKKWQESESDCRTKNGSLVSMETEAEWNFIKDEIQNINTTDRRNEWYIGLTILSQDLKSYDTLEEKKRANWRWTSGERLTIYDKWQPNEPNNNANYDIYCGVMAKSFPKGTYGLFKDVNCGIRFPYICEYNKGVMIDPSFRPVCWDQMSNISVVRCTQAITPTTAMTFSETTVFSVQITSRPLSPTNPTTTTTTTAAATTIALTTAKITATTTAKRIITETLSMTSQTPQSFSYLMTIVIVLAVVLVAATSFFILMCCWMRKKKGELSMEKRSSRALQNNLHTINNLNGPSSGLLHITGPETVIYAEINERTAPHPTPDIHEYLDPVDSLTSLPPTDLYFDIDETKRHQQIRNIGRQGTPMDDQNKTTYHPTPDEPEYLVPIDIPKSPTPTDLYSSIDDSNRQCMSTKRQVTSTDENKVQVEDNTYESIDNDAPVSKATSHYAVVDISKKSREITDDTIATKGNKFQNEENLNGASVDQSSSKVAAMYAVADKSKKAKRKRREYP